MMYGIVVHLPVGCSLQSFIAHTIVSCIHSSPHSLSQCLQGIHSVPLGMAAQEGHILTVERLLEGEANVNHQDEVWKTC